MSNCIHDKGPKQENRPWNYGNSFEPDNYVTVLCFLQIYH